MGISVARPRTRPVAIGADRIGPALMAGAAGLLLAYASWQLIRGFPYGSAAGADFNLYVDVTKRWLSGGSFYESYQVAGPYDLWARYGAVLYPPLTLWLFIPFTVLPSVLWWIVPLGVTVASVAYLRPAPWSWPFIALCACWPPTLVMVVHGNPVMWAVAAMSAAVVWRPAAALVLLKPSLFPFAFFGATRRAWWLAVVGLVVIAAPFGLLWLDWLAVIRNAQGGGLLYSIQEVPMLLLPVVAWLGSARRRRAGLFTRS